LTGAPNLLFRFFNPALLPMHNLTIMNRKTFAALFNRAEMQKLYCDYYGIFKVSVCGTEPGKRGKAAAMNLLMNLQLLLNMLFRMLFGKQGAEGYCFSPYLIYIGTKEARAQRNEKLCDSVD
jgi:hypothetical protein